MALGTLSRGRIYQFLATVVVLETLVTYVFAFAWATRGHGAASLILTLALDGLILLAAALFCTVRMWYVHIRSGAWPKRTLTPRFVGALWVVTVIYVLIALIVIRLMPSSMLM